MAKKGVTGDNLRLPIGFLSRLARNTVQYTLLPLEPNVTILSFIYASCKQTMSSSGLFGTDCVCNFRRISVLDSQSWK